MLHSYGKKSPRKSNTINNDLPEVEILDDIDDCNLGDDLDQ